jgi:hypothetical protein
LPANVGSGGAPSESLAQTQLRELHIRVVKPD